ncbi:hypothetical protein [Geomesophilobacter sediminis]|uniref:Uncharacterized protein n=1 Tax=Geomesophilobacter sediminis TaxID=2798584 RepID=A0A8J7M139_9BACT|nr:hypothetical protein [Geomesophilobacter sediminis]MBJ6726705.1 hypothetical protein [Geomesophilobacter sediminis]
MLRRTIALSLVSLLSLSAVPLARAENTGSYPETVAAIERIMNCSKSPVRNDTYPYLRFQNCRLDYVVSGTYPVGTPYTLSFTGLDFSGLNPAESRTGHDYTAFVLLYFGTPFTYRDDVQEIKVRSTVVNVANDKDAAALLKAFFRLGELCRENGRDAAKSGR